MSVSLCLWVQRAGVEAYQSREQFPDFCFVGHYDKMVMNKGEDKVRAEFERLVPFMKSGGFIPSVDHQTPPSVSLQEYQTYLKLLKEYTRNHLPRR